MQLGMIGLGKMGANMTERLVAAGHDVVGFDLNPDAVAHVVAAGARGAASLEDLMDQLDAPRAVWIMVPHGRPVDATLEALLTLASPGDTFIDGGNSYYKDTIRRAEGCDAAGHHFVDVGTSGGIWGITEGYSMMVGGAVEPVERLRSVFEALAPAPDRGWGRVGPSGSGHFVKMVHNGIEYGLMQAYAEGFALMGAKTEFDLDLAQVGHIWQDGSVVRSWLLDLTTDALEDNPAMDGIAPYVPDSGEGRWMIMDAIEKDVPVPTLTTALFTRFRSRQDTSFAEKMLAALRKAFCGDSS